ncbi:hypothetical protein [Streptomyces sp. f150]|uniref:hypothetical protein n=1 Tax=Streptomyces sp. f150 TaxID=1827699 RepID=UPI0015CEF5FE|nr:hypothetical protein [Streptomyces sp. f150]
MEHPEEHPKPVVRVTVDTSSFLKGVQKFRSNVLFAYHDDLVKLDDELDILYRGQL